MPGLRVDKRPDAVSSGWIMEQGLLVWGRDG